MMNNHIPFLNEKPSLISSIFSGRPNGIENLHGSARFATFAEITEMGLFRNSGVYIGGVYHKGKLHYLRHDGPEHVMAFAPTRSGKGVGLVLPTLLSWEHSAVIFDVKGENWALTSGWRSKYAKNRCLKFDPASPNNPTRFNPLLEVRIETEYETADIQNLAYMIVDPDGKGLVDHWAKTGHALLVGAILHCMYVERQKGNIPTLKAVYDLLADPSKEIEETLDDMLQTEHVNGQTHDVVASCARSLLNKADAERSGVISTSLSYLELYKDPIVAASTEASDFRIADLMNADDPVSLYLVVSPSDQHRLKPLIRLMITQIVRKLTEKMEFANGETLKHYKHRLLLMIDEFPTLGKLRIIEETLAYMAGYGLKAYLIVQDLSQLYAAYGKDESIISNCGVRIAYAPNKIETAKLLSSMLGVTTVLKKSVTTSRGAKIFAPATKTVSWQEHKRDLMTPDECMKLRAPKKDSSGRIKKAGDMLIFVAGHSPIYGRQILHFKDRIFLDRSRVPVPERKNHGHENASKSTPQDKNLLDAVFNDPTASADSLAELWPTDDP